MTTKKTPSKKTPSKKTTPSQITGTVLNFHRGFYEVACPDAAPHLRTLYLRLWQMSGAKIGETVTLEYQTTPSYGLWNVVKV